MARSSILAVVLCLGVSGSFAQNLNWCCIKGKTDADTGLSEFDKCETMVDTLNTISNTMGKSITFECVEREDCETSALKDGHAHLVTLDAGILFENMKSYNARPILSETYAADGKPGSYQAVVYLKANQCTDTTSMATLQNKRACSTGFRKTAGWRIPIGKMLSSGAMPIVNDDCDAENDAESAASFFSAMCAPDIVKKGGGEEGSALETTMCSACNGDCTAADPYAGYSGAFRGLTEGACDVAFAKDSTLNDVSGEGWFVGNSETDFKLLCPFGGCIDYAQLSQFPECAWAATPSHATVVNPLKVGVSVVADVQAIFKSADKDSAFRTQFYKTTTTTVNGNDLLFKSSTMGLVEVKMDMRTYLGDMYEVYQELETVAGVACSTGAPGADGADGADGRNGNSGSNTVNTVPAAVPTAESSDSVPVWGVVLFVVVTVVLLGVMVMVFIMVRREKQGTPMFRSTLYAGNGAPEVKPQAVEAF